MSSNYYISNYIVTSGTSTGAIYVKAPEPPPLTPYEHNVLLQKAGYAVGIEWSMEHMRACGILLARGYMTGTRGSPYPHDYRITAAGRAALQLRLEDAK